MNDIEALERAREILRVANVKTDIEPANFLQYAELISEVISNSLSSAQKRKMYWLKEWAEQWRRLYDNFDARVAADPMILYRPRNHASESFHKSQAFIRYFRAGNRTSKTQSGYAEDYWFATAQHPYRIIPYPSNIYIVAGLPYTIYAPGVFEAKMVKGDEDNPISPMFPERGKWFNHFDNRTRTITISCPICAEAGKGQSCPHEKSRIVCISSETGIGVLEAFAARLIHIDEHIPEEFFPAAKQRLMSSTNSSMVVTGTPLHGLESWETRKLAEVADGNPELNKQHLDDPSSHPYVTMHEISQYEANITPKWKIEINKKGMDEFEIESRIYGKPAPLAKNPVFDRTMLAEMRKKCTDPRYGDLIAKVPYEELTEPGEVDFHEVVIDHPKKWTGHRIWEEPKAQGQYLCAVDTAAGLAGRDASCCTILEMVPTATQMRLNMVAQFYGWMNPMDYADEVFKLCIWYNQAKAVIELTGGLGMAVMLRLKKQHMYWNLYREASSIHAERADFVMDARFGIDTNPATKPMMVAALQDLIKKRAINIPCRDSIAEMVGFEQEKSPSGKTTQYRGAAGAPDDRTMSLVIGAAVAVSSPEMYDFVIESKKVAPDLSHYSPEWREIHERLLESEEAMGPFE